MHQEISRRHFLKAGAATALSLTAAGGLLDEASNALAVPTRAASAPVKGGTLTCGTSEVITDLSPWTGTFNDYLLCMMINMYEPLVGIADGGALLPILATSWSHSPDYKTWTFHIRKGVKFHTGADMTSADVMYTLNQINSRTGPANFVEPLGAGQWGGATAPDPSTVVVKLHTPLQLDQLMRLWVITPKGSQSLGSKLQSESVGTGPFKLSNFVQGSKVEMVANTDYWNAPRPYLSNLNFVFLSDTASQVANFASGAVTMLKDVGVLELAQVKGKNNSKIVRGGLFFHWWEPQMLVGALASQQARVALRHAFNRPKLNEVAWANKGISTWNPFDETQYGIHEKVSDNYDIALARKLIKAAGVAGEAVNINVLNGSPTSSLEAQVLVEDFQAAGLKAAIVPQSATVWNAGLYTDRTNGGITNNYSSIPFPYQQMLLYLMSSTVAPDPPKYPKSPVPTVFAQYNAAFSQYKPGPYAAALKAAQRGFLAECTVYNTFLAYLSEMVPQNLQGLDATTFGDIRFADAYLS